MWSKWTEINIAKTFWHIQTIDNPKLAFVSRCLIEYLYVQYIVLLLCNLLIVQSSYEKKAPNHQLIATETVSRVKSSMTYNRWQEKSLAKYFQGKPVKTSFYLCPSRTFFLNKVYFPFSIKTTHFGQTSQQKQYSVIHQLWKQYYFSIS